VTTDIQQNVQIFKVSHKLQVVICTFIRTSVRAVWMGKSVCVPQCIVISSKATLSCRFG